MLEDDLVRTGLVRFVQVADVETRTIIFIIIIVVDLIDEVIASVNSSEN
jgi:hypothetical protein